MSSVGQYKFNNYNEKLDEIKLETEDGNVSTSKTKPLLNNSGGGGVFRVILPMMLPFLIILQLILMGMTAYNMTLLQDSKCACDVANNNGDSVTQTSVEGTTQTTCNTTEMQAYINQVIQATSYRNDTQLQQSIQTYNDIVIKLMEDSSRDILQLLHELQAMDMDFQDNATETMSMLFENTEDYLLHIINTLSNHKDTSISTSSVVDDILIGVNELLDVHNTSSLYDSITPAVSCKDIKVNFPNSPSGYYHVNNRDIYCNMDELCGSGGGWTRLAHLDMTDSTVNCPDELQYIDPPPDGVRMCQRNLTESAGCSSPVKFPSTGISYSEICGRVIGYQYASPDAVDISYGPISSHYDLNSYYVDGVSITRGSPRQHVWTFMNGKRQDYYGGFSNCPCNTPPDGAQNIQSFIGSHYFCESGNPDANYAFKVYTSDPLWDGKGCGSQEGECCNAPGLPWFHRQYTSTSTDSLDLRICGDQSIIDEDTPVSFYEIFVK